MLDAIVIGAGLAGLACTVRLEAAGRSVLLLEREDVPGGRVRTDVVDGFRLDRGFQILLTHYPEAERLLDYKSLRLRPFVHGALVWQGGRFHHFADPFRDSLAGALGLLFDPVITAGDKMRVAELRSRVHRGGIARLFEARETTTRAYLQAFGFSPKMIDRFFTPFFGGVFLERELVTSSRYFEFLFRMFAYGEAAVPEAGMEMIPRQLAVRLRTDTLLTSTPVVRLRREGGGFAVETGSGNVLRARALVMAADEPAAHALLESMGIVRHPEMPGPRWNRTTTLYYAAARPPVDRGILMLNGEGPEDGPVNNAVVMSLVSPRYAPPGAHLIAASIVGAAPADSAGMERLEAAVRAQMQRWFGPEVSRWAALGGYPIERALPLCLHAEWNASPPQIADAVFACGDYRETPSIQGALASGDWAAEAVLRRVR